jgi:murein DD-endopeptidase MepM/ murein hydrolase activator NlpD
VVVRSLSLFGGAVTAAKVSATDGNGTAVDLRVEGSPVVLAPGESVVVGGWGRLTSRVRIGERFVAPLALRLLEAHAKLPAGTVVLVAFAAKPVAAAAVAPRTEIAAPKRTHRRLAAKHRHRHGSAKHLPLKVTPPLGLRHYVFPVAGDIQVGDSYGGARSDIADGWHHGDDIFAPIGTPVLAVADGTLNRVGWERLGGWRLWLRDSVGNEFYYAHLAAYSRLALHARSVKAGEVIGFVGRTGDAYTTAPHLHFEIHPRPLLHLHYDGAVDPTRYLRSWTRETPAQVPPPARPPALTGLPRTEAAVVWRQLLAARHITLPRTAPKELPHHVVSRTDRAPASQGDPSAAAAIPSVLAGRTHHGRMLDWLLLGIAAGAVAASATLAARRRLAGRQQRPGGPTPAPPPSA